MLREPARRFSPQQRVHRLCKRVDVSRGCQINVRHPQSTSVELAGLHQRIVLGRRIDVCSDSSDRAVHRVDAGHAEVCNLHDLLVSSQKQILRLDVAMNHATLMRVSEPGADLLEIKENSRERQRVCFR